MSIKMMNSPGSNFINPNSMNARTSIYESPQARHKKLREMLDRTSTLQENATVGSLNILEEAVGEVDVIHNDIDDKIINQDQIVLDSEVMKVSAQVIRGAARSLDEETNSYNAVEFTENLLRYARNLSDETLEAPNWELLGRQIAPMIMPCGSASTLLHCMELMEAGVHQKRSKIVNRRRDALLPAKKPEKIVAIANDDNPVDKSVDKIAHLIRKYYKRNNEPLNFFKLIVNPHDFGKTVENMLHVSFLVNDGRMALSVGGDGDLFIQPVAKNVFEEQQTSGNAKRIANIPSLTLKTWKLLIDVLEITEPMIDFE
ncbi:EP300-interacting inhibitor of differentiation 3 isoform X2 [Fopius arisanus]|uniref:Non-structural maintenance of chromosomes element 4 n=1 Tax=Fopius arisanus TaxID=64838 RepID=A0A0C9Q3T6_9HYME|nr:PREDICTED: EP300-interacting inhibitor of differentiation 3 isoform X2 [Fopius arisanus]